MTDLNIRDETARDYDAVRKLLRLAFGEDSPGASPTISGDRAMPFYL
jgi:predicted N-acetyltransferase YhbS